VKTLKCFR